MCVTLNVQSWMNVIPQFGVRIVGSVSLQIWSDIHSTVFTVSINMRGQRLQFSSASIGSFIRQIKTFSINPI